MILKILILVLSAPLGFLLAWMSRDELISGRKWFRILIIISLISGGWLFLIGEKTLTLTLFFILITAFISYVKSFDKKWVKK